MSSEFHTAEFASGWASMELARRYFHHSEHQRQDGFEVLFRHHRFIGTEMHLDYGCGDGKNTVIMSHLTEHTDGVEVSEFFVKMAAKRFPPSLYPRLQFHLEPTADLSSFAGTGYDIVTSFFVFHLVRDPLTTLRHIRQKMRPGGKFIAVVPVKSHPAFMKAGEQVLASMGNKALESQAEQKQDDRMTDKDGAKRILEKAGFSSVLVDFKEMKFVHIDEAELVEWCIGTLAANWSVPEDQAEQVFSKLVKTYLEIYPEGRDADGFVTYYAYQLQILAVA